MVHYQHLNSAHIIVLNIPDLLDESLLLQHRQRTAITTITPMTIKTPAPATTAMMMMVVMLRGAPVGGSNIKCIN